MRRCLHLPIRYIRSFGSFIQPAGVAIVHNSDDVYVLDITGQEGSGTVQELMPPVMRWPNSGPMES